MLKFNKLHHVAIICSEYERSKRFYTEVLGATVINEFYRAERNSYKLDLRLADCQIELFSFPNPPSRVSNPEACGLRHLAFEVDDAPQTKTELEKLGIVVEEIRQDPVTQKFFTFFKDPDGLPIEVYQK